MAWSHDQKLDYLLRLPWTIVPETTPEGDRLLRVEELPSAVGHGDTESEIVADFWESLRATLECYLHFNDPIPLPMGEQELPWITPPPEIGATRRFALEQSYTKAQEIEEQTGLPKVWKKELELVPT